MTTAVSSSVTGSVGDYLRDLSEILTSRASGYFMGIKPKGTKQTSSQLTTASASNGSAAETGSCGLLLSVTAGAGMVSGRLNIGGWAVQDQKRLDSSNGVSILKSCLLSLINGTLGQRGLLMSKVQSHNIAVRFAGVKVDFCVWLPSMDSDSEGRLAEKQYAEVVKDALSRLSTGEVRQYFPLFIFGAGADDGEERSMLALPMAAPAAVPVEGVSVTAPAQKDVCEMVLCTTKQKKRKGVPYCGTCRKFMEETVKWYCDTHRRHPAKEKDKFVPAVRNERYACKHPKMGSCDCKACHSLRRFEEMYPKCEAKLDEFKRRTFMFEDTSMEKPVRDSKDVSGAAAAAVAAPAPSTLQPKPDGVYGINKGIYYNDQQAARGPSFDLYGSVAQPKTPQPAFGAKSPPLEASPRGITSPPTMSLDPLPESVAYKRKRKLSASSASSLGFPPMSPPPNRARASANNDDIMSNLLPNYLFNGASSSFSQGANQPGLLSSTKADTAAVEFEGESLYKDMFLEDPLTFLTVESMAQMAPLNTWLCNSCAAWNHPSNNACTRCYMKRP